MTIQFGSPEALEIVKRNKALEKREGIKKIEGMGIVTCPCCKGWGHVETSCPYCNADTEIRCPECDGKGEIDTREDYGKFI